MSRNLEASLVLYFGVGVVWFGWWYATASSWNEKRKESFYLTDRKPFAEAHSERRWSAWMAIGTPVWPILLLAVLVPAIAKEWGSNLREWVRR